MSYSYRSRGAATSRRSTNYKGNSSRGSHGRSGGRRTGGGSYIDPIRFVQQARPIEETTYEAKYAFTDFDVDPLLLKNLIDKGYETPSPIQDQTIPAALEGRDIIGIASTGTGKTAAFALPLLNKLMLNKNSVALIVAPTRELAQQIEEECRSIAKGSGLFGTLLIGGSNMSRQLRDLKDNPQIIIGTPGRIKDHLTRRSLKLHNCNMIVLDEVDRMLDMGFVNDVTEILSHAAKERQSMFFSATMDNRIQSLLQSFTEDPYKIMLKPSASSENIHQDVVHYQTKTDKMDKLHDLLLEEKVTKVIVFNETKRDVEQLSKELVIRGFSADALHGGKSQGQRQRALQKFKKSEISILVATDVAARGIDVADISHVVNFSLPREYEDYIHRIGRTGRAGQIGYAYTFVAR